MLFLLFLPAVSCWISTFSEIYSANACSIEYFRDSSPVLGLWHPPPNRTYQRDVFAVWGTDHHRGPGAEFSKIFPEVGVEYLDYGLKKRGLEMVPNMSHKQALGPLSWEAWETFRRDFFNAHRDDEDLKRAHAVLCSMPVHFCLLLLPFNKPIIAPFAFRFEGPYLPDKDSSFRWFEVLREMDRHPDVILGGTNMYDTMYNNHFLGSRKQAWLPLVAHYVENWDPTGWQHGKGGALTRWYHADPEKTGFDNRILVGPYRLSPSGFSVLDYIRRETAALGHSLRFPHIRDLYPEHYEYSQLCDHEAILLLPYSAHAYGVAETRWMNVPMLIPSRKLYAEWIKKYHIMYERVSQPGVYERDPDGKLVGHDFAWFWDPNGKQEYAWNNASERSLSGSKSPIDDSVPDDTEYWLSFADFYSWEAGVIQFDDVEDLLFKIETTDWAEESRKMALFNKKLKDFAHVQWESVFARIFEGVDPASPAKIPDTYDEGMRIWAEKTARIDWHRLLASSVVSSPSSPSSSAASANGMVQSSSTKWVVLLSPADDAILKEVQDEKFHVVLVSEKRQTQRDGVSVIGCFEDENFLDTDGPIVTFRQQLCSRIDQSSRSSLLLLGILHAVKNGAKLVALPSDFSDSYIPGSILFGNSTSVAARSRGKEISQTLPIADPISAVSTSENRETLAGAPYPSDCSLFINPTQSPVLPFTAGIEFVIRLQKDLHTQSRKGAAFARPGTLIPTGGVSSLVFLNVSTSLWSLIGFGSSGRSLRATMLWQLVSQRLLWELDGESSLVGLRPVLAPLGADSSETEPDRETARLIKYLLQWVAPPRRETDCIAAVALQLAQDLVAAGFLKHRDTLVTQAYLMALTSLIQSSFPPLTPSPHSQ